MTGRAWTLLLLLLIALPAGGTAVLRCEAEPPRLELPESLLVGGAGATATIAVEDAGSGLRSLRVVLVHAQGEAVLLERSFARSPMPLVGERVARESVELEIDPQELELNQSGDAVLRIAATDHAWRNRFAGNRTEGEIPVTLDFHSPRLRTGRGLIYPRRGGSGMFSYAVNETTQRDGIEVAGRFFPGVPAGRGPLGEQRVVLFAIPVDAEEKVKVRLLARDLAGNGAGRSGFARVREREFPETRIALSDRFLEGKVRELAAELGVDAEDPVAAFQEINTRVRAENEARIQEVLAESEPTPLFTGAFEQWRNSQVTSGFAERRGYYAGEERVSEAVHYGYDLASFSNAPVHASGAGRVVFAEPLGIYGNCVLIDHGLGLASLYGHLSGIDVEVGQRVERGDTLGLSGDTGLAGGDHLHFAMLVRGVYVDPIEWWDEKWVREHAEAKLARVRR